MGEGGGASGPLSSNGMHFMVLILDLSLAKHEHFEELHVQWSIHGEVVLSWGVSFWVWVLMSVRCLV